MSGGGSGTGSLSRRRFLGISFAGALAASAGGRLVSPTSSEARRRDDPYDFSTWEALAARHLTLRDASGERTITAYRPVRGLGRAYTVVLRHDGTGRYVATFNS